MTEYGLTHIKQTPRVFFFHFSAVRVSLSAQVYLLVLSVTTLSLLLAPGLWRVTTHIWVPRNERKTIT